MKIQQSIEYIKCLAQIKEYKKQKINFDDTLGGEYEPVNGFAKIFELLN